MAYIINKYNGTVLTTVEDGTVNQLTELKFIGKNYAGYGEAQNENFLFLLENFAGSTAPAKPISGMIWFDNTTNKLKVYDGSKWKTTGGTEVQTTEPTGFGEGEFWWNTTTEQLYVKNVANEWVLVGPQAAGSGETQMRSITLTDTSAGNHNVIAATINDNVVFIVNKDADFTNSTGTAITGFDVIKQGVTLIDTRASTNGVTSSNYRFWGTASNSIRLNGRPASDYITTDNVNFTGAVTFGDAGFTLGNDTDLTFSIDTDLQSPVLKLVRNVLRVKSSANTLVSYFDDTGFHPGATNTFDLGKNTPLRWRTVYATTFNGTATQADTLKVGSAYKSASVSAVADTVAARTAANETIGGQTITAGALKATFFVGTATTAQYADLAEKYTTEITHPVGTAMAVCTHGDHETCPGNASHYCIGVISEKPAYLMNSHIDGQAIALKGRVPVRVAGPVKKGQPVYVWADGICTTMATTGLVGIALESNSSDDEKLVECVLKV